MTLEQFNRLCIYDTEGEMGCVERPKWTDKVTPPPDAYLLDWAMLLYTWTSRRTGTALQYKSDLRIALEMLGTIRSWESDFLQHVSGHTEDRFEAAVKYVNSHLDIVIIPDSAVEVVVLKSGEYSYEMDDRDYPSCDFPPTDGGKSLVNSPGGFTLRSILYIVANYESYPHPELEFERNVSSGLLTMTIFPCEKLW